MSTSPTMQSVSTKQVNAQNWLNDRLCGLNSDDFRPDSIAIFTTLQLAVPDEFSDVAYTTSGVALTDNEVTLLRRISLLLIFCHTSDNDQKRQAEHLHRGLPELDVISLASNANTIGTTILRRTSRRQTMIHLVPRLLATPSMIQLPPTALVPLNDSGLA